MKALYPLLWRWHFIIGLLAAPVLITVSLTGALYVFEPQLEPMIEPFQTHADCTECTRLKYSQLAANGHATRPDWILHELVEQGPGRSIKIILEDPEEIQPDLYVFVDPYTGEVLHSQDKGSGIFPFILRLHRSLLSGETGRYITELTISWVFVTLFLGFILWWPRRAKLAGGWWPRFNAKGRKFWRDIHSVTGFYFLPVFLLITFTGLFFSPLAGKTILAGMYVSNQLPELYINPPKLDAAPAEDQTLFSIDAIIDDYLTRSSADHFDVHFPEKATDLMVFSSNVATEVWKLRQSHYHPYTGELIDEAGWQDLKPGAKALMLFFPLHTGNIFGIGTQILAFLAAVLMVLISAAGIYMWWLRRKPGELGLPAIPDSQARPSCKAWLFILPTGIFLPAFGASLLIIFVTGGLLRLWKNNSGATVTITADERP